MTENKPPKPARISLEPREDQRQRRTPPKPTRLDADHAKVAKLKGDNAAAEAADDDDGGADKQRGG